MEYANFSLEDDDIGMFITQTPSQNDGISASAVNSDLDEGLMDFQLTQTSGSGEVGNMEYSDISDVETDEKDCQKNSQNPTFE